MRCAIEYNSNHGDGFRYAGHEYDTHMEFRKVSEALDFMRFVAMFQTVSTSPIDRFAMYKGDNRQPTEYYIVTDKGKIRKEAAL